MLLRHQYLGIDMQIHNSQRIKLYKPTSGIEPKKPNHLKTEGIPLRVQIALKTIKNPFSIGLFQLLTLTYGLHYSSWHCTDTYLARHQNDCISPVSKRHVC